MLEVGDRIPDFTLVDQDKNSVTTESFLGKRTLIVFIPFPFTSTCEAEVCGLRDNLHSLQSLDCDVVVITCDTRPAHRAWAEQNGFQFPILSDFWPHGEVSRLFGCFDDERGSASRVTFGIDATGVIEAVIRSDAFDEEREVSAYIEFAGARPVTQNR